MLTTSVITPIGSIAVGGWREPVYDRARFTIEQLAPNIGAPRRDENLDWPSAFRYLSAAGVSDPATVLRSVLP